MSLAIYKVKKKSQTVEQSGKIIAQGKQVTKTKGNKPQTGWKDSLERELRQSGEQVQAIWYINNRENDRVIENK